MSHPSGVSSSGEIACTKSDDQMSRAQSSFYATFIQVCTDWSGWIPHLCALSPVLSSESRLVWHLLIFWWPTLQPSVFEPITFSSTVTQRVCQTGVLTIVFRKLEIYKKNVKVVQKTNMWPIRTKWGTTTCRSDLHTLLCTSLLFCSWNCQEYLPQCSCHCWRIFKHTFKWGNMIHHRIT